MASIESSHGRRMRWARPRSGPREAGYDCIVLGDRLQGRGPRRRRRTCPAGPRLCRRGATYRDAVRRRTHGNAQRRRRGRPPTRNMPWRWLTISTARPASAALAADTDGTDGGPRQADLTRPAPLSTTPPSSAPGPPASIPPRFSPTTIPRGFSTASAIYSCPDRRSPTSTDFRAIIVDRPTI